MAITNKKKHLTIGYKVGPGPLPPQSNSLLISPSSPLCLHLPQVRENIVINPPNKSTRTKWSSHTELIVIAVDLR